MPVVPALAAAPAAAATAAPAASLAAAARRTSPAPPPSRGRYHTLSPAELDPTVLAELPPALRAEVVAEVAEADQRLAASAAGAAAPVAGGGPLPEKRRRGSDSKLRLKRPANSAR